MMMVTSCGRLIRVGFKNIYLLAIIGHSDQCKMSRSVFQRMLICIRSNMQANNSSGGPCTMRTRLIQYRGYIHAKESVFIFGTFDC